MKKKKDVWVKVPEIEKEIAQMLSGGHTVEEIATLRDRSPHTIRSQIAHMQTKFGFPNTTSLVTEFLRRKIIE